jgi:hypothetical protein
MTYIYLNIPVDTLLMRGATYRHLTVNHWLVGEIELQMDSAYTCTAKEQNLRTMYDIEYSPQIFENYALRDWHRPKRSRDSINNDARECYRLK